MESDVIRFMIVFTLLEMIEAESVHRTRKNIAIDIYRVMGLFQLDLHVLHQILVDIFRLLENILSLASITSFPADGGVEEYHALLQLHQR